MLREQVPSHCWHTLFQSYGVNLPSSLTVFHPNTLGFSPCLPESVCGTVYELQSLAAFLVSRGSPSSGHKPTTSHLEINETPDFPSASPYMLEPESNNWHGYLPSPLHHSTVKYRNINLLSIDYAFRPRLRNRLTLGGLPFPRKP